MPVMNFELIPYGPLLEVLGSPPLMLTTDARTARELLDALHQQYAGLAPWRGRIACACGDQLLNADGPLQAGMQIALIPPVSGG